MSRFYEALKKAEQERARGGPASNPLGEILEDLGLSTAPEAMSAGSSTGTGNSAGKAGTKPSLAGQLSFQQLQQHCPPKPWNPKPEAVLWSNSGRDHPGVEEFRSLRSRLHQIQEKVPIRCQQCTARRRKELHRHQSGTRDQPPEREKGPAG